MFFFFFNHTPTTAISTLSLHDALPISRHWARHERETGQDQGRHRRPAQGMDPGHRQPAGMARVDDPLRDRKSTRLNSSHVAISYAVFCLKKKKKNNNTTQQPQKPYRMP